MKKLLSGRATEEDTLKPDSGTTSTPRWVKVFGIITILLILLVVIMMFFSGGKHGPGRHLPSSSGIEQGVKQP